MKKRSHNKKRNVGIIYEQLVFKISTAIIENDNDSFQKAKTILKKHFKKDTQLYREFRLLNSLVVTNISDGALATAILSEAKGAARRINERKLNLERSRLIKEINHTFGKNFYSIRVKNYKDLATTQRLLDEWRKWNKADPGFINEYQSKVHTILLREKSAESLSELKSDEANPLVLKIMQSKFNKSYANILNEQQNFIINEWVKCNGKPSDRLLKMLEAVKTNAITEVAAYKSTCENSVVAAKIDRVISEVKAVNFKDVDDEIISRALVMCELKKQICGDSNE